MHAGIKRLMDVSRRVAFDRARAENYLRRLGHSAMLSDDDYCLEAAERYIRAINGDRLSS